MKKLIRKFMREEVPTNSTGSAIAGMSAESEPPGNQNSPYVKKNKRDTKELFRKTIRRVAQSKI